MVRLPRTKRSRPSSKLPGPVHTRAGPGEGGNVTTMMTRSWAVRKVAQALARKDVRWLQSTAGRRLCALAGIYPGFMFWRKERAA